MERFKGSFFAIVGVMLLVGAIMATASVWQFQRESIVTEGRVVELNAGGSHPEIMFKTRRGETISYPQGGWIAGYKVGDVVQVRYREADPHLSASLDRFGALFFGPLILAFIGGGFVVFGTVAVLTNRIGRRIFF